MTEGEQVLAIERLRIAPALVQRDPERVARYGGTEGDRELAVQEVEAAASHAWFVVRTRPMWRRVLGFALLALLAAGCAPRPRSLPAEPLAEWVTRAELARGLQFERPVPAREIPAEGVARLLDEEFSIAYSDAALDEDGALKSAFELLPPGADLRALLVDFQSRALAGYYSPLHRALTVVRSSSGYGAELQSVIVHELVHALQDQHSALMRVLLGLEDHDDLAFALGALLEGDALWATADDEQRRLAIAPTPPAAFMAEFERGLAVPGPDAVPPLLRVFFIQQYPLGYRYVAALRERGRQALAAALEDPPLSSADLLHPERLEESPRPGLAWWSLPDGFPCQEIVTNGFGELGLRVFAQAQGATPARAASVGEGWVGDRAFALRCPRAPAFAWRLSFRAPADVAEVVVLLGSAEAPFEVDRAGTELLLSRGLASAERARLIGLPGRRVRSLADYLRLRPEVLERADRRRARAAGRRGGPPGP